MRSWMKVIIPAVVTLGGLFANAIAEEPGHDYPPFVKVNGYVRTDFLDHRFDKAVFVSDDKGTSTTVAGHFMFITYKLVDSTYGGDPYLINSLMEQLKSIPSVQILNQSDNCKSGRGPDKATVTARFEKGNNPVWIAMSCYSSDTYYITVVEEQAFHP